MKRCLFALILPLFSIFTAQSQSLSQYDKACELYRQYNFAGALEKFRAITDTDSAIVAKTQEMISTCENGINMLKFALEPKVLNSRFFPIDRFVLSMPEFETGSWIPFPNSFCQNTEHRFMKATLVTKDSTLVFSAPDENGSWNLYSCKHVSDTLWTEVMPLEGPLRSEGDEILPHLSPDGRKLYFASNGMAGMGGYDLYVSTWDSANNCWGAPENLGFPYSSVDNDLFYIENPDGRHTTLYSDRNSQRGTVQAFVLETISTPIKTSINSVTKAARIASLAITDSKISGNGQEETELVSGTFNEYYSLIKQARAAKQEYDRKNSEVEEARLKYSTASEEERSALKEKIETDDIACLALRSKYESAKAAVHKAESDFLSKGIIPEREPEEEDAPQEGAAGVDDYSFAVANIYGTDIKASFHQSAAAFNYSFRVEKESLLAPDQSLPSGLCYQIQLIVASKQLPMSTFKGLTPIYETAMTKQKGKWLYAVGIFKEHAEALKALKTVRSRKGYEKAYIIAWNNRKSISVKDAVPLEKKLKAQATYQVCLSGYGDSLPSSVMTAIKGASSKDLAKVSMNGSTVFVIGPFSKKADADKLASVLSSLDITGVSVEKIDKK